MEEVKDEDTQEELDTRRSPKRHSIVPKPTFQAGGYVSDELETRLLWD